MRFPVRNGLPRDPSPRPRGRLRDIKMAGLKRVGKLTAAERPASQMSLSKTAASTCPGVGEEPRRVTGFAAPVMQPRLERVRAPFDGSPGRGREVHECAGLEWHPSWSPLRSPVP